MGSYSEATSDLDEDFPVYDFLQCGGPCNSQASQKPDLVVLDSSDTEVASSFSPASAVEAGAEGDMDAGVDVADVMMISSESEAEDAYVPLALRLKQRQESVTTSSSTVTDDKDIDERHPASDSPSPGFSAQNGFSESEPLLSSWQTQWRTEERGTAGDRAIPLLRQPLKPSSWAGSTDTSPAKRKPAKRTAVEIQASREEALRRKGARERQQGDKEAHRLEQERQKAERKALAEAAKALRPEECIKHMVVVVDPALLQMEGGGTLLTSVQDLGCNCAIEKQLLPRTVNWVRRSPCLQTGDVVCVPEDHVVMQMTVEDFVALVHSYTQCNRKAFPRTSLVYGQGNERERERPSGDEQRGGGAYSGPTLTSWVQDLQAQSSDKILSLVVIDLEKYFRSHKSQSQKKFREAVLGEERVVKKKRTKKKDGADELPEVSRVEVEEAVVDLQLHTGVAVRFLSAWKDFNDHIVMTTKAIAEAPFKREREKTGFSFYLESDWAGGQRVDRAGKGLLQVWKRQIQQLNRVSPDMASAILSAYPSPQLLIKAYRRCKTDSEKISLLSDLLIRRGEGVTSTTRRVGPELSKRLFLMMTSPDPEQALDSTA